MNIFKSYITLVCIANLLYIFSFSYLIYVYYPINDICIGKCEKYNFKLNSTSNIEIYCEKNITNECKNEAKKICHNRNRYCEFFDDDSFCNGKFICESKFVILMLVIIVLTNVVILHRIFSIMMIVFKFETNFDVNISFAYVITVLQFLSEVAIAIIIFIYLFEELQMFMVVLLIILPYMEIYEFIFLFKFLKAKTFFI